jgi:hypothetical protein
MLHSSYSAPPPHLRRKGRTVGYNDDESGPVKTKGLRHHTYTFTMLTDLEEDGLEN